MSQVPKVKEIMNILRVSNTQPAVVSISPIQAKEILRYNTNNRRVSENIVNKYTKRMLNNQWRVSNDAIAFSHNGELSNGQHRLRAIIKSDKTIDALIAFNTDNFTEMDRGKSRTISDNIQTDSRFRNTSIGTNKDIQQIATNVVKLFKGKVDTEDVAVLLEKYKDEFGYLDSLGVFQGTRGLNAKSISSAFFVAYVNGEDATILKHIRDILNSGITEAPQDIPIIALRDKILALGAGWIVDQAKYKYTCYTIGAVSKGLTSKRCQLVEPKYKLDLKF